MSSCCRFVFFYICSVTLKSYAQSKLMFVVSRMFSMQSMLLKYLLTKTIHKRGQTKRTDKWKFGAQLKLRRNSAYPNKHGLSLKMLIVFVLRVFYFLLVLCIVIYMWISKLDGKLMQRIAQTPKVELQFIKLIVFFTAHKTIFPRTTRVSGT